MHPPNKWREICHKTPGNRSISISRYLKHILFFSNSHFFERKIIFKIAKNRENPRFHSKYQARTAVEAQQTVRFVFHGEIFLCNREPLLKILRCPSYYIPYMFIYFLLANYQENTFFEFFLMFWWLGGLGPT